MNDFIVFNELSVSDVTDSGAFLASRCANHGGSPEYDLIREALLDAVRIAVANKLAPQRDRIITLETLAWIADDSAGLFGYRNCCEMLGIEPESLRRALKRWREMSVPVTKGFTGPRMVDSGRLKIVGRRSPRGRQKVNGKR